MKKHFNVGDKVIIKHDLKEADGIVEPMVALKGQTATITKVMHTDADDCSAVSYHIDIDDMQYFWWNECFEDTLPDNTTHNPVKGYYQVGDYVRITSNVHVLYEEDVHDIVEDMLKYEGQLARITDIDADGSYRIDLDNGEWKWSDVLFIYRLGNYEDNNIPKVVHIIGYHYKNTAYEFKGLIDKFSNADPAIFYDESGKVLCIPINWIDYIVPIGD